MRGGEPPRRTGSNAAPLALTDGGLLGETAIGPEGCGGITRDPVGASGLGSDPLMDTDELPLDADELPVDTDGPPLDTEELPIDTDELPLDADELPLPALSEWVAAIALGTSSAGTAPYCERSAEAASSDALTTAAMVGS